MSDQLITIACWTLLPSIVTRIVLKLFYQFYPQKRPQITSPHSSNDDNEPSSIVQLEQELTKALNHVKVTRALLVSLYIVYTIINTLWTIKTNVNYYELLGLTKDQIEQSGSVGSTIVKTQFRKLAKRFHPDKIGQQGQEIFVELRKATDVLDNEVKRWTYERFGSKILNWSNGKQLASRREYLMSGLTSMIMFYVMTLASHVISGLFRSDLNRFRFWQWWALVVALIIELNLILSPDSTRTFQIGSIRFSTGQRLLRYQLVQLLHQSLITFMIIINQLTPLFEPIELTTNESIPFELRQQLKFDQQIKPLKPLLQQLVNNLETSRSIVSNGSNELLNKVLIPIVGQTLIEQTQYKQELIETISFEMKQTYIDQLVQNHDQGKQMWFNSIKKAYVEQTNLRRKLGLKRIEREYVRSMERIVRRARKYMLQQGLKVDDEGTLVTEWLMSSQGGQKLPWVIQSIQKVEQKFKGTQFSNFKFENNHHQFQQQQQQQEIHFDLDGRCKFECGECKPKPKQCRNCLMDQSTDDDSDSDDTSEDDTVPILSMTDSLKPRPQDVPLPPSPPPSPPVGATTLEDTSINALNL
ncbi:hypothetical protein OIO90_000801 [Microbotryomycetes sp. JL221]|nr:hypothetical protein OIO90_000801 [Microbotryomycetes sp. JL221]